MISCFSKKYLFAIFIVPFLFCHPNPVAPGLPDAEGTVLIRASGRFFTMGAVDSWAASDEKPPMRVGFYYDFRMDTTEITVAQYWQTVRRLPKQYSLSDTTLTTPITFVTWFDAALFCNRRSLDAGLDTVYTYLNTEKTADGKVYRMSGCKMDFSCYGYRLPTEAEWEYVARNGSSTVFAWGDQPDSSAAGAIAWFESNAADKPHPVAQLTGNSFGIYDLFGNVSEWVNDWKGFYEADTITNFIGPFINNLDERPVRGGSFLHSLDFLRPSCRSDEYSTLSSTATEYLGFRCCIGRIPDPSRINTGGTIDTTNPVHLTSKTDFSWLPTRNAKVVFINKTQRLSYLCYSDFSETNPRIYQFADMTPVYAPTISPDGQWVAFCTREEGQDDGSAVYIRRLDKNGTCLDSLSDKPAFIPRWWVDPQTTDTFLVYTTSAIINTMPQWESGQTKMQKIAAGVPAGAPVVLEPSGSFHDGLSADRRFLATGYTRLYMKDIISGEQKTLFTAPENGKSGTDTSQVCNVSLSPDTVGGIRVMFLDFGSGSTPSTLVGSTYSSHQVIFISDFYGRIVAWYRCPADLRQWDHPEWSNHPDYVVCTGQSVASAEKSGAVYGINLRDSSYHKCIEGTDLLQPYLWISGNPDTPPEIIFDPDSAGWYDEPPTTTFQKNFAVKMPQFLSFADSIEVLGLGSSRIQNGMVPLTDTARLAYNFGYAAGGLLGVKNILYNYALGLCPKLRVIAVSLDICWWNLEDGDFCWNNGFEATKGYSYDRSHRFWPTGLPDRFVENAMSIAEPYSTGDYQIINAERGWYPCPANGWGPDNPAVEDGWKWTMNQNCADNIQTLDAMARELKARSIELVAILFPQSPRFKNTPVYGFEGPLWETADEIRRQLQIMEQQNDHFHLYDANHNGDHDYAPEDFFDNCHLSDAGGRKFSIRFNALVDSILGK